MLLKWRGIGQAAAEARAFLDNDDFWTLDKLERQAPVLSADDTLDGVFGHVRQFADASASADFIVPPEPQPGISRDTLLIRRSAFERFGFFDQSFAATEFVGWCTQAIARGLRTRTIPEVVAYRRIHATNTGIVRRQQQQQENLLGLKRALDIRRQRSREKGPAS